MYDARIRNQWDHTSHVMAAIYTASGNLKKGVTVKASDFNPMAPPKKRMRITSKTMGVLKSRVLGGRHDAPAVAQGKPPVL